jgi:BASS family bile acid:Na+ symporter
MTAIASILAVFMTPLNLSIWGNLYQPTSEIINEISIYFFEMLEIIGVILILPLITGMLLRNYLPKVADGLNKFMQIGSLVIFVGIVYFAFSANFDLFTKYIGAVLFIVLAHNTVGILTGLSIAMLFKLPKEDKKTIAIETGIQNSGLGLGLIFTFFDGLGGMAIIAGWWGIWHILSGLSIAYFFRKKW